MQDRRQLALQATRALRESAGYSELSPERRASLERDLASIESTLTYGRPGGDPYATVLETPFDLQTGIGGARRRGGQAPAPEPKREARPQMTDVIGSRAAETLEAVDFPGFISGLVTGTFQAIVDATIQQLHEYAELIGSLARTADDFSRDNVSDGQARQYLLDRHGADLTEIVPRPGETTPPRLVPRPEKEGSSPVWLEGYELGGEILSAELTEGPLLAAARRAEGEKRLQTLATTVLLGINRIIVDEGHIRARMQFHAVARDRSNAETVNLTIGQAGGIAGRTARQSGLSAAVSTVKANAQAEAGIKANLMGEVELKFSTQTFPIERLADPELLSMITGHSRWRPEAQADAPAAAPPVPPAPDGGQA
ncbi:MAG: hypothetical protein AAF682_10275 [Planctomycetota bacterium]